MSLDPRTHPRERGAPSPGSTALLARPSGIARSVLPPPAPALPGAPVLERPRVRGKFLFAGDRKLWVRGVTYGTFRPGPDGDDTPDDARLARDFAAMSAAGLNALRTYTAPPVRLLDAAAAHGLRVLVGLAWEQHVAFLDDRARARSIVERVRAGVAACAGHPAVLGYAIGNEIPAPIVRWHGARRVEGFLERLCDAAHEADPEGLVTYVNYPTTEYLHLPFLDFTAFNVYLERQTVFRDYLARLHHEAGDRPLVLAELGLDSRRNGERAQARALDWQIRTAFAGGCAGAFAFAWTDEWHRGGHDVEDWDFGLVDRGGRPKPALAAASQAFDEIPFHPHVAWPRVSVVVCTHNGARTIRDTLDGLRDLEYSNYEVVVVDDGSTDQAGAIARSYLGIEGFDLRVFSTENRGLSAARNLGLAEATGEIVAYIDDDAFPDPQWLTYLAAAFLSSPHAGIGGPNVTPPEDGRVAACVANAPGGPIHVLVSDLEAEHIPGCNMAFRRADLRAIGGFDARFRSAGDDVDVCWRLQDAGGTLGFCAPAMVWHHRRSSIRAYWRQQLGYGRAEALLEAKWPERYNRSGHLTWAGRLYNNGHVAGWRRGRIYQGVWGSAPFQSLYQPAPGLLWSLPAMPEWLLGILCLAALSALGLLWSPLLVALPLLVLLLAPTIAQAILGGLRASFPGRRLSRSERLWMRAVTAGLHLLQPAARLRGRLRHGLTPWRSRSRGLAAPIPATETAWSETWCAPADWVETLRAGLREGGAVVQSGGDWDRWDLEARLGALGSARVRIAAEEHGAGRQLVRARIWPRPAPTPTAIGLSAAALGGVALVAGAGIAGGLLLAVGALLLGAVARDAGAAVAAARRVAARLDAP